MGTQRSLQGKQFPNVTFSVPSPAESHSEDELQLGSLACKCCHTWLDTRSLLPCLLFAVQEGSARWLRLSSFLLSFWLELPSDQRGNMGKADPFHDLFGAVTAQSKIEKTVLCSGSRAFRENAWHSIIQLQSRLNDCHYFEASFIFYIAIYKQIHRDFGIILYIPF